MQFTEQLGGQYVASSQSHPTSAATGVTVRNGRRLVTAGPFAETREKLLGHYIIEVQVPAVTHGPRRCRRLADRTRARVRALLHGWQLAACL